MPRDMISSQYYRFTVKDTFGGYPCIQKMWFDIEVIQEESAGKSIASTDVKQEKKEEASGIQASQASSEDTNKNDGGDKGDQIAMFPLPPQQIKNDEKIEEDRKQRLKTFQSDKLEVSNL